MNTCPKIADYTYPTAEPEVDKLFQKARALQKQEEAKPFEDHDHSEIVRLYTLAAEKSHWKAMNNLALLYEAGYYIPEDEKKALALFKKMEEMGIPEGYINLASAHEDGLAGLSTNPKQIKKYLIKAAEIGHPRAQFLYGKELLYPETIKEAKKWLDCALQQDYDDAAFYLAILEENDGAEDAALQYYRRGAMLGSSMCLGELSLIYRQGKYGTKIDNTRSQCYFELDNKLDEDPSLTFPDLDEICPPSK